MKTQIIITAIFLFAFFSALATPPAEEGKQIFSTRCAGCHNINKVLTGPALAGIEERRSMDWIISFVHSSQSLIKSGDKDAIALFEQFNRIPMPDHQDLSADHIKSVVAYIQSESKTAAADAAPFKKPGKLRPDYTPISTDDYGLFIAYIALVLILAGVLVAFVHVKATQRQLKGEE